LILRAIGALIVVIVATACATARVPPPPVGDSAPPRSAPAPRAPSGVQTGRGSWYGEPHHGRKTASGEVYDMNALTAAHRDLPLGTRVRVTNVGNGRSVVVRINDRGPYVGGRVIDLSRAAAREIGALGAGVFSVRLEVLEDAAVESPAPPPAPASR
jgi:rare lipoprotein A